MSNTPAVFNYTAPVAHGLGGLAFGLALATLAGARLPFIANERTAIYALGIAGFTACSLGMAKVAMGLGWTNPITVAGILLGALAMLIVGAVYFGIGLPLITSDRAALIALTAIVGVKVALALLTVWFRARG